MLLRWFLFVSVPQIGMTSIIVFSVIGLEKQLKCIIHVMWLEVCTM